MLYLSIVIDLLVGRMRWWKEVEEQYRSGGGGGGGRGGGGGGIGHSHQHREVV